MKLEKYLNDLKNLVDKNLDRYLPSEREEPKVIHKAMRYSVFSGGKRLRPILAIESSRVCGGGIEDIMPAACAIELVHTYSLIHDDLPAMDDDDYRRGKPASHKVFGEANAILTGDALLTFAFNIISKYNDPGRGSGITRELSDAIGTKGMVGGQVLDLGFSPSGGKKDKIVLNDINRLKTARLFAASTKIGAIAAKPGQRKIERLAKFGTYLGMAFQIVDDIIDDGLYVRIFGRDLSRLDSENFIKMAKSVLKIFGKKADRLGDIADYVLERSA